MRVLTGVLALSVCVLVAVTVRVSAQGQGAQTPPAGAGRQGGGAPSNLQVLPKDWTGMQVQQFMQNYFRVGTGMMCNDCHVQGNRASDDKKEKQTARQMLKMMFAANDALKGVGEPAAEGTYKVTCYTCHRGQRKPINAPPAGGGF